MAYNLTYDLTNLKNLHDLLLYSPRVLDSYEKTLFILYQLLRLARTLHSANLTLGGGELKLSHIFIDENFWIRIKPPLREILDSFRRVDDCNDEEDEDADEESETKWESQMDKALGSCPSEIKQNLASVYDTYRHLNHRDLADVTKSWTSGRISNFAYLLILNCIAGRFNLYFSLLTYTLIN